MMVKSSDAQARARGTRDSRRVILIGLCLGLASLVSPAVALAQHPLCPAPSPQDTYFVYCSPYPSDVVSAFLYDFSVSQLFKGRKTFEVPTDAFIESLGLGTLLFSNADDRRKLLADRPAVEFRPLDRLGDDLVGKGYSSSGEFILRGLAGAQTLVTRDPLTNASVRVDLPEVVQGLYWRSPAHLELQFYAGHGIKFTLSNAGGEATFQEALQCVSMSQSEMRATTADPKHRNLLARFGSCQ